MCKNVVQCRREIKVPVLLKYKVLKVPRKQHLIVSPKVADYVQHSLNTNEKFNQLTVKKY